MNWDPLEEKANHAAGATPKSLYRLKRDLMTLCSEPLEGVLVEPDETDILRIHALFVGPIGTPYEKGFFHFVLGFPPNYPISPPKVRLMTTDAGRVRFNPNLYSSGKVCLSILGTYPGPEWSAAQGLRSVLLAIQTMFNERPYSNEPGHEQERNRGDSDHYNEMLTHETVKVAILGNVADNSAMPDKFKSFIQNSFIENYSFYETLILSKMCLTGQPMKDPLYHHELGRFSYDKLLDKLESLKTRVLDQLQQ